MANRLFPSNDSTTSARGGNYEQEVFLTFTKPGNITADETHVFVMPFAGKVTDAFLSVAHNGVDSTNPLQLELEVSKNGSASVFTTKPLITKAATAGRNKTTAAATGVTPGVVNPAANSFVKGDQLDVVLDITRTASPGTEISGASFVVVVKPAAV